MPDPVLYLKVVIAVAVASSSFVLVIGWTRRPPSETRMNAVCVAGIGLGLAVGFRGLRLDLAWPPTTGLSRLVTIVLPAAMGIELVAGFQHAPQWLGWSLRAMLAAVTGRVLLHDSVYLLDGTTEWTTWQAVFSLTVSGILLLVVWALLAWLSQRSPSRTPLANDFTANGRCGTPRAPAMGVAVAANPDSPRPSLGLWACNTGRSSDRRPDRLLAISLPLVLAQSSVCGGLAVMVAGYVGGGAAALPQGVSLVAVAVASSLITIRSSRPDATCGILGIGVVGLFGLLFVGRFFGGLSTVRALAVFLSPLLCWVTELPSLRCRPPSQILALRLMLAAIPLIVVLIAAKRDFDRDTAPLLGSSAPQTCPRSHNDGPTSPTNLPTKPYRDRSFPLGERLGGRVVRQAVD